MPGETGIIGINPSIEEVQTIVNMILSEYKIWNNNDTISKRKI
jgi:hypothetical protein